jgi:prepilin-type N-terminal cleavage/methylation domain-containing protein
MANKSLSNPRPIRRAKAGGFTLVELMIVLIIIGILGSVIMFAMFGAQEAARAAKTKNMISKLNAAIMQRYETYMHRRVPLLQAARETPQEFHFRRLQAIRELMRFELPDRWTDVKDKPVTGIQPPAVSRTYLRRIAAANNGQGVHDGDTNQGAECLYMIIAHGTGDGDALTHFSQSDIGDLDNDGLSEFLDGWGQPIGFIRWPAGFASPRQSRDETKEFDQFNPHRALRDISKPSQPQVNDIPPNAIQAGVPRRFAMFPLIYSGGPDRRADLVTGAESNNNSAVAVHYSVGGSPSYVDPYLIVPGTNMQMGQPIENDGAREHGDNIHNHELSIR